MTSRIISVTSVYSLGCTFLDWSLYWLQGSDQFFSCQLGHTPLVQDPLGDTNAHRHPKNHPSGLEQTQRCIETLQMQDTDGMMSLYPHLLQHHDCCEQLGIAADQWHCEDIAKTIHHYQIKDYHSTLQYLHQSGTPIVFVAHDESIPMHLLPQRSITNLFQSGRRPKDSDQQQQDFEITFFPGSRDRWQELGLTEIWDQRERMALDLRPFQTPAHAKFTLSVPHIWVACQDLWFDTEHTVVTVMQQLGLPIIESRLSQWREIASRWSAVHNHNLKFARRLPHIVESIVQGAWHAIPPLSLDQEAIIQHCLIYQHDLNLKTWKLEHFPNNTLLLHQLLEPNQHTLT